MGNGASEVVLTPRDWGRWLLGLAAQSLILIAGAYAVINSRLTTVEVELRAHRELQSRDMRELTEKVADVRLDLQDMRKERRAP